MERAEKIRTHYLGTDWQQELDPNKFANQRLSLAAVIAALGELLPEAEKAIAQVKKGREELYGQLRGSGDMTSKDAESKARAETFEALWQTEYDRDIIKNTCDGLKEITNALSSKISTLGDQARFRT